MYLSGAKTLEIFMLVNKSQLDPNPCKKGKKPIISDAKARNFQKKEAAKELERLKLSRFNEFFGCLTDELKTKEVNDQATSFAIQRLVRRCRKKAELSKGDLEQIFMDKFVELNEVVGETQITANPQVLDDAAFFLRVNLERFMTGYCPSNIQNTLDMRTIYDSWTYGPGASNGIKATHAAEKVNCTIFCTSSCEPYIKTLRANNVYFSSEDAKGKRGTALIDGSKLGTVLKNEEQLRTTAKEPLGNMMLQLGAGHVLAEVCASVGFRISTQQEKNNLLAMKGSRDGSNATLDLSSASDMFSLKLLRRLWPAEWVKLLCDLRSEMIFVRKHGWIKMNMVSTMGNGFTFPFMTLTIIALIYGLRAQRKNAPVLYVENVHTGVYGDDIIVPVAEFDELSRLLADVGLVVNKDKSFCHGYFRESCGGDYWLGVDVTPFYVKDLSNDSGVYVAINQLVEWSAKYDLFLFRSYALLLSFLTRTAYLIPEWMSPEQGIMTPLVSRRYKYLQVISEKRALDPDSPFMQMLACAGYIESDKPAPSIFDMHIESLKAKREPEESTIQVIQYTPKSYDLRVRSRSGRLPQGYLTGADPLTRSAVTSAHSRMYSALMH